MPAPCVDGCVRMVAPRLCMHQAACMHSIPATRFLSAAIAVLLVACAASSNNSDSQTSSGGSVAGGGGQENSSATNPSDNASSSGGGKPNSSGGGTDASGAGGAQGSDCPSIFIGDGIPESCSGSPGNLDFADQSECPSDSSIFWPARIFEVTVAAGDCLAMQADNVGSPLGADLFGAIVSPEGTSILYDEETPCSVPNPEGYACPSGAATMASAGKAFVMVGMWEGKGCTPTDKTAFTLRVSLNGQAVDLAMAPSCSGDLQSIIP